MSDQNLTFQTRGELEIAIIFKSDVQFSIWMSEAKWRGKVLLNQTLHLTGSSGVFREDLSQTANIREYDLSLGALKSNPYEIHIAVGDTPVKTIIFTVK